MATPSRVAHSRPPATNIPPISNDPTTRSRDDLTIPHCTSYTSSRPQWWSCRSPLRQGLPVVPHAGKVVYAPICGVRGAELQLFLLPSRHAMNARRPLEPYSLGTRDVVSSGDRRSRRFTAPVFRRQIGCTPFARQVISSPT
jgi:hypothetical protein